MTDQQPPTLAELAAFDRLKRPVWLFDHVTCRALYANTAAVELWGAASAEELVARDYSQLSPAVRTRTERLAAATVDGASVTERWTFYPGGRPLTVQAVISSMTLADGSRALFFEAAPVDVEEGERRAVEALRHTSSLITLFDVGGAPLFANPATYASYGHENLEFAARFVDQALGADVFTRVLNGEILAELARVRTCDGERSHHFDARRVLDPVSGEVCVLLSERDVTAQVEAELALAGERERAEVAVAKQRFLANMSHELRTPLNSIIGFAGLLKSTAPDATAASHAGRVVDAGEGLLSIINDMITLSAFDGREVQLREDIFDPSDLLARTLKAVEAKAAAKGLMLECETPEGMPHLVGDEALLRSAIAHYLENAVKFADAGTIQLCLAAEPVGDNQALCEISVIDQGPGIEEKVRERLFHRFSPGDDSQRKQRAGAGLGLAIVKETAALMGGEAGVESTPGQGSRFWIRFTLSIDGSDVAAMADETPLETAPLRVLYADDHDNNRALVQAVLATQGHHCDVVCDGAEAVRAVESGDYHLVLMDIQMPVMDGVAAARRIRARHDLPILAVTANTLSEQLDQYLAAGMQDCIAKPVAMAELISKVAHWAQPQARRAAA